LYPFIGPGREDEEEQQVNERRILICRIEVNGTSTETLWSVALLGWGNWRVWRYMPEGGDVV